MPKHEHWLEERIERQGTSDRQQARSKPSGLDPNIFVPQCRVIGDELIHQVDTSLVFQNDQIYPTLTQVRFRALEGKVLAHNDSRYLV